MQVCGLKLALSFFVAKAQTVTPHVGVWIETLWSGRNRYIPAVTPHVGVWIETAYGEVYMRQRAVTPHVGVWIETEATLRKSFADSSHTSCRCVD